MSKLKKLSTEDLDNITEFFLSTLNKEISARISVKELTDVDIKGDVIYENEELQVNVNCDLFFDKLSNVDSELLNKAVDSTYDKLDVFIDENYRL